MAFATSRGSSPAASGFTYSTIATARPLTCTKGPCASRQDDERIRNRTKHIIELDAGKPIWDRCFMVAPLVLVGTRDEDGSLDLAPKAHGVPDGLAGTTSGLSAAPVTRHTSTSSEPASSRSAIPSLPRYFTQVSPRHRATRVVRRPSCRAFPTFPAKKVDGEFIEDAYLFLECRPLTRRSTAFGRQLPDHG